MPITSPADLRTALQTDLRKSRLEGLEDVVNDALRKVFSARSNGAIFEFAHNQGDADFWKGVKYYSSGSNSRVKIRRTPQVVAPKKVKVSAKRKALVLPAPLDAVAPSA